MRAKVVVSDRYSHCYETETPHRLTG